MDPAHPNRPRRLAILGASGSIGTSTLEVLEGLGAERNEFEVVLLAAHRSVDPLLAAARRHGCRAIAWTGFDDASGIVGELPPECRVFCGADAILEALDATEPDVVLNGITGAAGLAASAWTLRHGKPLLLANKESLVVAGPLLTELARVHGAPILPVDSEHAAIHQCLRGERRQDLRKIWLTASGGPFRDKRASELPGVSVREALAHPTWNMGPRISIGSATLMNKTFEVLEAHHLFDLAPEEIDVVVHRQSIVHSMVGFRDGSILAQLGVPDMRLPIAYCLGYPKRLAFDFEGYDPMAFAKLTFEAPDPERFPALRLGWRCIELGGNAGAVLNAADEVATAAFLDGRIRFPRIATIVEEVLEAFDIEPLESLDHVFDTDRRARDAARNRLLETVA
ncbi:MAG: 1-deoxy-D-xylulose-5-phosphate reductoisomerase [Planctomycetes bacterium]|nr:1-deoxy-D-xylulose-5-phosphate reductoisomerase [Planctomycetota bacterium]